MDTILTRSKFLLLGIIISLIHLPSLSAQVFGPEHIIDDRHDMIWRPVVMRNADLDNDGDNDIVAFGENNEVVWFENLDGTGTFSNYHLISMSSEDITDLNIADIDGDDDIDIFYSSAQGDFIFWHENNNGSGSFSNQKTISSSINNPAYVFSGDVDSDGDVDIISTSGQEIVWFENTNGSGSFGSSVIIGVYNFSPFDVKIADLDGDGDNDILASKQSTTPSPWSIAWQENLDGAGNFGEQQIISDLAYGAVLVDVADVDNDNDLDIVAAFRIEEKIAWFENTDGLGNFILKDIIFEGVSRAESLDFVDLDGDGDFDILASLGFLGTSEEGNRVLWFENQDGLGAFGNANIIGTGYYWLKQAVPVDIDNDNDKDVIIIDGMGNKLAWFENMDGLATFGEEKHIASLEIAKYIFSDDIDGDSTIDIITLSSRRGAYFKNLGEEDGFDHLRELFQNPEDHSFFEMQFLDIDQDGDNDCFIKVEGYSDIYYFKTYENINSEPKFIEKQVIGVGNISFQHYKLVDYDNDGDTDLLVVNDNNFSRLEIYKNQGDGFFDGPYDDLYTIGGIRSFDVADFDNDNDWDIVYTPPSSGELKWVENQNGTNDFENPQPINNPVGSTNQIYTADITGNGFMNIIAVNTIEGLISWYDNVGGNFFNINPIANGIQDYSDLEIVDLDGDQDLDFLVASIDEIFWYENLDGQGIFSEKKTILFNFNYLIRDINVGDIDSDGDLDIILSEWNDFTIAWVENVMNEPTISGFCYWDANANGTRDSLEIGLYNCPIHLDPEALTNFSDDQGNFVYYVDPGDYMLSIEPAEGWELSSEVSTYSFSILDTVVQNLEFGLTAVEDIEHVDATIISGPTRCGFTVPFWIHYENTGTLYTSGFIAFELDSLTTLIQASPLPDSTDGHILYWYYESLPPTYGDVISLDLEMPGVEYIGTPVFFDVVNYIGNEADGFMSISDNKYSSVINCAYDPNDKLVDPIGIDESKYTLFGEELTYTVRFQNTGTDTAFTVRIEDLLDANLNWETFRPIGASHDFTTSLYDDGRVVFLFENILLPDSTTNEPRSHGFISFSIMPKDNLQENTPIYNTADIYFDFNPAIVTNTTLNSYVSQLPTSVENIYSEIELLAFPNPFDLHSFIELKGFPEGHQAILYLYNIQGQLIQEYRLGIHQRLHINGTSMAAGSCFYELRNLEGVIIASGKLIKAK